MASFWDLHRFFALQIMLSEWLLETPVNFETDWVMVPCPVGRRNLVIAARVSFLIQFLTEIRISAINSVSLPLVKL